jgi:hypothetical protein
MRVIYRIHFPNITYKSYVGKTKRPKRRNYDHFSIAKEGPVLPNGEINKKFSAIHAAIRKYGIENTVFEVIATCLEDTNECANYCEKLLIKQYDSFNNGYNLTEGGDGGLGYIPSSGTNLKNSLSHLGKPSWERTPEFIAKISGENSPSYGKVGKDSPGSKRYRLYFEDGRIIEVHGLQQWCKENGYQSSLLNKVCSGERKFHKDIIKVEKIN